MDDKAIKILEKIYDKLDYIAEKLDVIEESSASSEGELERIKLTLDRFEESMGPVNPNIG
ncbi:MAG: hypothetical protein ABS911_04620 [Carnobacterium sp.]|uniref:hypothetical protein n=1 Tax=Carnobacterium sp. TaxID=48221 RepID=UPI003314DFC5